MTLNHRDRNMETTYQLFQYAPPPIHNYHCIGFLHNSFLNNWYINQYCQTQQYLASTKKIKTPVGIALRCFVHNGVYGNMAQEVNEG